MLAVKKRDKIIWIYLGKSGRDSRPPASQSAVRLPEAHLHLQAEGQRDQSSDAAESAVISADLDDLSNSPEGVANWATNNKHVDNTNNIILAVCLEAAAQFQAVWASSSQALVAYEPTSSDMVSQSIHVFLIILFVFILKITKKKLMLLVL